MASLIYMLVHVIILLHFSDSLSVHSSPYSSLTCKGLTKATGKLCMNAKSDIDNWYNKHKDNRIVNKLLTGASIALCTTVFSFFSGGSVSLAQPGHYQAQSFLVFRLCIIRFDSRLRSQSIIQSITRCYWWNWDCVQSHGIRVEWRKEIARLVSSPNLPSIESAKRYQWTADSNARKIVEAGTACQLLYCNTYIHTS